MTNARVSPAARPSPGHDLAPIPQPALSLPSDRSGEALLAGNAFMRSLGRLDDGDSNDFVRASFLVAMQFDDRTEAASEAFSIVCEATSALVRTPRCIELATTLAPKLAKGYLHLGPEVERFLREHDQEAPRNETRGAPKAHSWRGKSGETHSWPPTAYGKLIASRTSLAEADRLAREIVV